ncbi:MAG: aminotransferase class IV [Desulfopila sp.]|jgi:branched-chain amino acid aminotransferase|nr:aminotransferase class IV [Desulfopila sp.]
MALYFVDGQYVEAEAAVLPLTDMAILRGYAVFDFLRTYRGKPFHLEEHLARLQRSAALLHIPFPWSPAYLEEITSELLRRNSFAEANIRFLITGGDSADSITPLLQPRLAVMATEMVPFPSEWYRTGVKVITADVTRYVPGSKSTNYIQAILALRQARADGAIESVYVNEDDQLLEGTTSNIFFVKGTTIVTPKEGILPGITRDVVLRLAQQKFSIEQDRVLRSDLPAFTEAFLTSSNKEVVPVTHIDAIGISSSPGPVTREIMALFRAYTEAW